MKVSITTLSTAAVIIMTCFTSVRHYETNLKSTQHKDIQRKSKYYSTESSNSGMLNVAMLSVTIMNDVAPPFFLQLSHQIFISKLKSVKNITNLFLPVNYNSAH